VVGGGPAFRKAGQAVLYEPQILDVWAGSKIGPRVSTTAETDILEEIQPATVRGVCYRLFTRGLIANMSVGETQKISRILARARERGEVDWDWIVDETRRRERSPQWLDLEHFRESIVGQYRRDFWAHQPETIEIWSEKGTVRGILGPVLEEFGVTFSVKHGFDSATSVHDTAELTNFRV
ncbi:MAG: hypothetical protein ACLPKT_16515, partial [Methylocella sp.]